MLKQLSIYAENKKGTVQHITGILAEQGINILGSVINDGTEYGVIRMIVSDPEKARNGLREKGFSAMLTDVLAVKLEDHVGELHKMTHTLCGQGLNIEYMYALASANRRAMIVKASDGETAAKAITDGGLVLYSNEEMCW